MASRQIHTFSAGWMDRIVRVVQFVERVMMRQSRGGKRRRPRFRDAGAEVTVGLLGNRTGEGWYAGREYRPPATPANTSTSPVDATVGEAVGDQLSVLNLREVNDGSRTGHDLTHNENPSAFYRGWFTGQVDEEGRRVVHIDGLWAGDCP